MHHTTDKIVPTNRLTTPQRKNKTKQKNKQIGYWVSEKGKCNEMVIKLKTQCIITRCRLDTAFHGILNAIGDICERTCHKVVFLCGQ